MNTPSDVTVCASSPVSVVFSGTAGSTFTWTNDNPAVGLAASGTGNIFFTAAQVTQQEVATVTVAPVKDGCTGEPVEFEITVNPGPQMDPPPDVTVCAGQPVSVTFTGEGTGFSWTNSNPAVGLGPAGTGNLNFTAAGVGSLQTADITVTPTGGACPGYPQSFSISVLPLPNVVQPANVAACAGADIEVNFSGTAGATFEWTNPNPAVGLGPSGTGNLDFTAAQVTQNEIAAITVTPMLDGCTGAPKTFQVTVKPLPDMDAPPDVTACAGAEVNIDFTAPPGVSFSWTNANPAVGLGPAGTGSVAFTAANWPVMQTATVTVTPTLAGCAGAPRSFAITILPAPVMGQPPDVTVCEGEAVTVVFSGTGGTSFTWQNSNPAIGLAANGSGPALQFSAANVNDTTVGVVTVTPLKGGCAGLPAAFSVTVINCCATSAGTLDTNSIFVCGPKTVAIQHLGNHNLEPGDTIRYILYSDPDDPTGSILQYSDSLYFPFLQGIMQFDSVYYAAVIAGNQLPNDSIDVDGPCFSLVKGPKIVWLQKPTISVGSPPAAVCRDGCVDVQFDFTGTPPFEFTWQVAQNGQVLISKNEVCAGYQMIVTLCTADFDLPPADNQYMDFQVNFFQDKWCSCGD